MIYGDFLFRRSVTPSLPGLSTQRIRRCSHNFTKVPSPISNKTMKKEMLVTLKVPQEVLRDLPSFDKKHESTAAATAKSRPKPVLKVVKKAGTPEPPSETKTPLHKTTTASDIKPVRKWVKKPLEIQSFTGYFVKFESWAGRAKAGERRPLKIALKMNKSFAAKEERDTSPSMELSSMMTTPEGTPMA